MDIRMHFLIVGLLIGWITATIVWALVDSRRHARLMRKIRNLGESD